MALTPQNEEAFLREVDEELRRDQLSGFWRRYGKLLAVAVLSGLIAFGGWLWWQDHREQVAGANGEKLSKQNGATPLDVSAPLAALQAAGAVLGVAPTATTVSEWLAQAVALWRDRPWSK